MKESCYSLKFIGGWLFFFHFLCCCAWRYRFYENHISLRFVRFFLSCLDRSLLASPVYGSHCSALLVHSLFFLAINVFLITVSSKILINSTALVAFQSSWSTLIYGKIQNRFLLFSFQTDLYNWFSMSMHIAHCTETNNKMQSATCLTSLTKFFPIKQSTALIWYHEIHLVLKHHHQFKNTSLNFWKHYFRGEWLRCTVKMNFKQNVSK